MGSNKTVNSEKIHKIPSLSKGGTDGWHQDVCQGIVMAYFLVMAVIYPLYAPGGYMRIGEVKYEFFRNVSLATLAAAVCVILFSALVRRDKGWVARNYREMSVTDWFAYGYFVAVMVSYLCSPYKEEALWGEAGWYMGAATQMTLVLLYFLFSRFARCSARWIGVWLCAAAVVFALGVCNRYSVYPIAMEGQTETFISTLGNINWFCGYWSVTAAVGMALYWCSDSWLVRLLAGIYSLLAVLAGVTQGSSSAYLVFAAVYLALLLLSFHSNARMYRFLELCMIFAASCALGSAMWYIPGLTYNYDFAEGGSGLTAFLLDDRTPLWLFLLAAACHAALRLLEWKRNFQIGRHRRLWTAGTGAVLFAVGAAVVFLLFDGGALRYGEALETMGQQGSSKLVFNEDWGNGRGAAWNCGAEAYRNMNALHKIVGAGPDCFADYVYDVPELAQKLVDEFANQRLTNAHSELLTLLVNLGAFGWLCYVGMFAAAFARWMKRAKECPLLYVFAVGLLAYTAHNLVSFQQVLNTPYAFFLLGIGESFCRSAAVKERGAASGQ